MEQGIVIFNRKFTEQELSRYSAYGGGVKCIRSNFMFLKNGSMVYDYFRFLGYFEALIDAVVNCGEDLDEMISLIFPEKVDHPIVKNRIELTIMEIKNNN